MSFDLTDIYALLPAVYRNRDAEEGGPLRELLAVIAEQAAVLEEDLAQLYDDQFIETCAEWVVPYIGDLVGARNLFVWPGAEFSNRAQVANTLSYRRRKGTAAVVEQLARDVTGWPANAVEFFRLLATTQYMNHLRPENVVTPSLRRGDALARAGAPFDPLPRTADVRRIETRGGRYNIPNVGIFLWRVGSYPLTDAPAYRLGERRYLFHPAGLTTALYNRPEVEREITHMAEPENVPAPITRRRLAQDLAAPRPLLYGPDRSINLRIGGVDVPPGQVVACDLSDYEGGWGHPSVKTRHAIDPVLGRLRVKQGTPAGADVRVTFRYGFSAEMGGGEYGRASSFKGKGRTVKVPAQSGSVKNALSLVRDGDSVEIEDNRNYVEELTTRIPAQAQIEVRAADERRPALALSGDWRVRGGADSALTLNGLFVLSGALVVPRSSQNDLGVLRLRHCTLLPGPSPALPGVWARPRAPRLVVEESDVSVEIDRCIVGAIRAVEAAKVRITNSIIDAGSAEEFAYAADDAGRAGASLVVENSTIIGRVHAVTLEASNTIFLAGGGGAAGPPVRAARKQQGCVRFSYVPPGSQVPRRYQCQPEQGATDAGGVRPLFTSLVYGEPGYCQLSPRCPEEIRRGADDEAEMGAFHDLYQPQREANLRARLEEYLRFGLEAGIFYAS